MNTPAMMVDVLRASREVLLNCGFCAPSEHGLGDPEINRIDAVIAQAETLRDGRIRELTDALSAVLEIAETFSFRCQRSNGMYSNLLDTPAIAKVRAALAKASE